MKLIYKENDPAFALADVLKDGFKAFLKFAAVLCACDKCTHVEREYRAVTEVLGYVSADNTLCKTLCNGGLADTRFTDKAGIVLRFTRKDTDNVPYLIVTPDHRVELLLTGTLDKVGAEFFQCVVGVFGVVALDSPVPPYILQRRHKAVG